MSDPYAQRPTVGETVDAIARIFGQKAYDDLCRLADVGVKRGYLTDDLITLVDMLVRLRETERRLADAARRLHNLQGEIKERYEHELEMDSAD